MEHCYLNTHLLKIQNNRKVYERGFYRKKYSGKGDIVASEKAFCPWLLFKTDTRTNKFQTIRCGILAPITTSIHLNKQKHLRMFLLAKV